MKNPVIALYITVAAALLMQFIPIVSVQLFSATLLGVLLLGLPFIRKKAEKDSPLHFHAGYLFRTLWIWSILLFAGLVVAGYLVSQSFTMEQVSTITQNLANADLSGDETRRFIYIAAIAIAPSMLYFAIRLILGWRKIIRT